MLTEDNYQGKLDALRQARELGISKWKAGHVLSWVEIEMNMPMYGKACSENVKSGKVSAATYYHHCSALFDRFQITGYILSYFDQVSKTVQVVNKV